jgi:hypothetical protein
VLPVIYAYVRERELAKTGTIEHELLEG